MLSLDEIKSREKDRNGHVSDDDLSRMKKGAIFLAVFAAVIIIAAVLLL